MLYVFSFTTYIGFFHSFFINPLFLFPIIILGVDRVLDENKPWEDAYGKDCSIDSMLQ